MSTSPVVSVIMPAHNSERYIAHAIESVIAQSFPDWELIIADDASKDGTPALVVEAVGRDSRIKMIRLDTSAGAAGARNIAIQKAVGRYIAFLDSDDIWLPEKLERQLKL